MKEQAQFGSWEQAVLWLREQPEYRSLVTDAFYDDPLIEAARRYHASSEWQAVTGYLSGHSGRALDVGAGRGIASYALASEGFSVTALEPDSSAIVGSGAIRDLAESTGLAIEVVADRSEHLPFPDRHFDVIFARATLHHFDDLEQSCREIYRVLKPGGRLLAVREHVISKHPDLSAFLAAHPLHRLYGGEHAYLLEEYLSALRNAGFHVSPPLEPLLSPINYFPHSDASLKAEFLDRVARVPVFGAALRYMVKTGPVYSLALQAAAYFDQRPGRLYSFVCDKQG